MPSEHHIGATPTSKELGLVRKDDGDSISEAVNFHRTSDAARELFKGTVSGPQDWEPLERLSTGECC